MQKELPAQWLEVLRKIQTVFPSAKIAGGALRDLMNDRDIKDVDIFCPISTNPGMADLVWKLFEGEDLSLNPTVTYTSNEDNGDDRALYAVFTLHKDGWQYDIILASPDDCSIHNFDINICQISHDGEALTYTASYIQGITNKEIKALHVNRKDRNAKRIERLTAKYPEFTVIEGEVVDLFN